MGFFDRIKSGLAKTAKAMQYSLGEAFSFTEIDDDFYEELEESLILADLGVDTACKAVEKLRERVRRDYLMKPDEVRSALKDVLCEMLDVGDTALNLQDAPAVVLVIGVNGVGKTTTIGKLANQLAGSGKRCCSARRTRSARPQPTSLRSGRTAPAWRSCGRRRAPIRRRWCMTPSRRRAPERAT